MLTDNIRRDADKWIGAEGPRNHVAVSSRARYARNLSGHRFAPYASPEELDEVVRTVGEAIRAADLFGQYVALAMGDLDSTERHFLRESRLISPDMEKVIQGRGVHVSPDCQDSIMVNEEDHLRIQYMVPGLQLGKVMDRLRQIEKSLAERLSFAVSERLGFLTACPTNTGTGLRVSVMLHLPALTRSRKIEEILQGVAPYGLTVRGFYGENTEFQGDFYQISNEITLGKSEDEIRLILQRVVEQIVEREEHLREDLFQKQRTATEDVFWRSWAILSHARKMNSNEALKHLSWLRLGIDMGMLPRLSHAELNRLVIDTQPAHLQIRFGEGGELAVDTRDELRARILRDRLSGATDN